MQERGSYKGIGFWLLTMVMALTMGAGLQTGCSKVNATEITSVSYMDTDGTEKTIDSTKVIEVTEATTELSGSTEESVWYVVKAGTSITTGTADKAVRISVTGKVNLILEDGASWTANGGIGIEDNGVFTVYGQKAGTGTLIAQNVGKNYSGIGAGKSSGNNTKIILNGGKIISTGGENAAGIGIGTNRNKSTSVTITINGANVTTAGGTETNGGGAGIGGGGGLAKSGDKVKVIIKKGIVKATGGRYGAGIGSGDDRADVDLLICGGEITAIGGFRGSGIGGTESAENDNQTLNIIINGGKIKATSDCGSGIGVSNSFKKCNIQISDGKIEAIGADSFAGIGGGCSSADNMVIDISGGEIAATGSDGGAGIGGKDFMSGGNITITGGSITATSTTGRGNTVAPAIGDGAWDDDYPYTPGTVRISNMKMLKAGTDKDSASADTYKNRSAWAGTDENKDISADLHYVEMEKCEESPTYRTEDNVIKHYCELCGVLDEQCILTADDAHEGTIYYQNTTTLTAVMKDIQNKEVSGVTYAWYLDEDLTNEVGSGSSYITPDTLPAGKHTYTVRATYQGVTVETTVPIEVEKITPVSSDFTFQPPENLVYAGKDEEASIQIKEGITGMGKIHVWYRKEGTASGKSKSARTAGTYQVYISVEAGTNYNGTSSMITDENWRFTIEKGTLTADNFYFLTDDPEYLVYDGTAKTSDIQCNTEGTGDITIKYYQNGELLDSEPIHAGDYTVKIDVAEGMNYVAAKDITKDEWTYTIAKVKPVVEENPIVKERVYDPKVTLKDTDIEGGKVTDGKGKELKGSWSWKEPVVVPGISNTGYVAVFTPDDSNYAAVEVAVSVPVDPIENAPDMPSNVVEVENTCKMVKEVSLSDNWQWMEKDRAKVLTAGGKVTAVAEYIGEDKGNYKNISVEVTITRAACEEDTAILYTGTGEKAPTCTETGIGHTECKLCGGVVREKIEVAAIRHDLQKVEGKAATETETGNKEYYICKVCGDYYADADGKTSITKDSVIVPMIKKPASDTQPDGKPGQQGDVVKDETTKATFTITSTDSKEPQVEYTHPEETAEKVEISDTVTINGVEYKVTSIAKNAFKNNKQVTAVSIGKNVTSIGDNAFAGCSKLKKVTIAENMVSIGKNAFKGCKKLKTITIKSGKLTKKSIRKGAFKGISSKTVIKVPKKKLKAYKKLFRQKGLSKKVKMKS